MVTFDINGIAQHVIDCSRAYHRFENIVITGNGGVGGLIFGLNNTGIANIIYRCRITATNRGASISGQGTQIIGCEVDQWNLGVGVQLGADNTAGIGCYVHDGSSIGCGFSAASSGGYYYCISANNGNHGFVAGQSGAGLNRWLVHCTSYNNDGYGVSISGTPEGQPFVFANCLFVSNTLYGIGGVNSSSGRPHVTLLGCGFLGNGSGDIEPNFNVFEPISRLGLINDPISDASNDDFRLRADAASVLGAGFPGAMLVDGALSEWRGAPDLGAVQQNVRALVNPGFVGAF